MMTFEAGAPLGMSHELRLQRLEDDKLGVASDLSALRTEFRTEVRNLKEQLNRIEDKLEGDRPTPIEMIQAMKSTRPNLEIDGRRMWLKVNGLLPIIVTCIAIALALAAWFGR